MIRDITYAEYLSVSPGKLIPQGEFEGIRNYALATLELLCGELPETPFAPLCRAIVYEADYIYDNGGIHAANGNSSARMSREAAAGAQAVYSNGAIITIAGIPLSPVSYSILVKNGLYGRLYNG